MQPSLFQSKNVRKKYDEVFDTSYAQLNIEQKEAVDHIDGPVMVIAGPGTGKTQILAVRIGKILKETDTQAHNILCLTYTDAATISMRTRLSQIIGPDAHRVHIYTFHGFCNQVIQENLGYFGDYRQLEPISDLERVDVYKEILSGLPDDHKLKKLKGDVNNITTNRLKNLFSLMKKENYDADYIDHAVDQRIKSLPEDPEFIYKTSRTGKWTKGDLKQKAYDEEVRKLEELRAGAHLFPTFQSIMTQKARYDYDDMILWVVRAFESDGELLLQYQERYQYFLVDEFQDTNGAQKKLLDQLISYWSEGANVFVVGDDDQAIYKFQGANLDNIKDFRNDYQPKPVVLVQNYRSSQRILNASMALIDYNQERIVKDEHFNLDKTLIARSDHRDANRDVEIKSYANLMHEQAAVAAKLESDHQAGRDLSKMAIIYRNHRQVEKLVEVLEKKGVPLNIKRRVDILKMPLIRNTLNILTYINAQYLNQGYTDKMLFEMMHYNFFEIKSQDIAKLIWQTRNLREYDQEGQDKGRTPLGKLINEPDQLKELNLHSIKAINRLNDLLDKWVADVNDVTLQVLFQNIINEGHILNYVLRHPDKSWLLQVLGTLFDLIKEESTKKPDLSLGEFLDMIEKMQEHKIPLAINKILSSEKGVQFITAHSSKGLEYEEVIVMGVTKDVWDKRKGGSNYFKYPPLINGDNDVNTEDERRLMYVAMTRAKKSLDITYSIQKEGGKNLEQSEFVAQIIGATELKVAPQQVDDETVTGYQYSVLLKQQKEVHLIDHDLIDRMLKKYKLSVTGLNKYLKCPITFYFEAVLRVPMARTKYLGYGRAIHYALEYYHRDLNEKNDPTVDSLLKYFNVGMTHHRAHFTKEEFKNMTALGHQILPKYYEEHLETSDDVKEYGLEIQIDHAEYEGVPIKGVLDRVAVKKDEVVVTDFKTGNATGAHTRPKLKPPSDKNPKGGDYWRQIVFYKILLESDRKHNWNMNRGIMDFVEPDKKTGKFTKQEYVVSPEHIRMVGEQIKSAWADIQEHKFDKGCGEDDCHWCNFVQNDYVMDVTLIDEEDDLESTL